MHKAARIKGNALLSRQRYQYSISVGLAFAGLVFLFDEIVPNIVFCAVALVSGISSAMCIYLGAVFHVDTNIALLILSGGQCAVQLYFFLGVKSQLKMLIITGCMALINISFMWGAFRLAYR